ncbi:universal stress family protein [Listeria grandensis FSL F6-0971]|uniref:Universal stress family protein n=1 Tax=Listeria grandensis FSL F6-0971 TaxID=1265819 RepID=W7BXN1_9LIST|nr:universal stress protein [Listeria grandensis]EUJ25083.1 universal stress family protein [Listeria grandensis FSL F6-0971]
MKIGVLIADDQLSKKIMEKTIGLCREFAVPPEITLIHVVNMKGIAEDIEVGVDLEGDLITDAQKMLAEKGTVLEAARFGYKTAILNGFPAKEVTKYANDGKLDMIIMGHHDLSLMQKVTIGSVAKKIIEDATFPVLLIK